MSNEILQPFQLASDGGIAKTSDPNVQAGQHIMSLISTSPTERVMIPTYGTSTKNLVFTPDDDIVGFELESQIGSAMAIFEPNIVVNNIHVISTGDPEDPAQVELDWSLNNVNTGQASGVQTATILVGGTIVQNGVLVP